MTIHPPATDANPAECSGSLAGNPPDAGAAPPGARWSWPWVMVLGLLLGSLLCASIQEIRWTHEDPPDTPYIVNGCKAHASFASGMIYEILEAPGAPRPATCDDPVFKARIVGVFQQCLFREGKFSISYRPEGFVVICPYHGEYEASPYPGVRPEASAD